MAGSTRRKVKSREQLGAAVRQSCWMGVMRSAGAVVLWAGTVAHAGGQTEPQQQGKPGAVAVTPPGSILASDVRVPLIDQPLRLSDFSGMQPREDLRGRLGHVENFIQNQPHDGLPGSEKTEVWMGHTS